MILRIYEIYLSSGIKNKQVFFVSQNAGKSQDRKVTKIKVHKGEDITNITIL